MDVWGWESHTQHTLAFTTTDPDQSQWTYSVAWSPSSMTAMGILQVVYHRVLPQPVREPVFVELDCAFSLRHDQQINSKGSWFITQIMLLLTIGVLSFLIFSYCRTRYPLLFAPRTKLKGTTGIFPS